MNVFSHWPHPLPTRLALALLLSFSLAACGGESPEALMDKAQKSVAQGDRKTAIIHLKSAIQENENNAEARFQLGKLYLEAGDFAAAEKELTRAQAAGYDAGTLSPALAKALIGQGEHKRVLDEFPQPVAGSASEVPLLVMRAHAQLGLGDKQAARSSLDRAAEAAPQDPDTLIALARLALADGDPPTAGQRIDEALRIDPAHRDAWLFKGELQRTFGKADEAAKAFREALKIDPENTGARLALADIAMRANRLDDARREVNAALKSDPGSLQANYNLALIDFRDRKFDDARDRLARVLKAAPNYQPGILLAGSVEYALGNMQTAEAHLNKALAANPRNLYALRLLASAQLRQGRVDDASRTLGGIAETYEDPGLQVVLGEIAMARRDYAKASRHYEIAARLRPEDTAVRTGMSMARLARGDERAIDDLKTVAEQMGPASQLDVIVILNQLKQKKFDDALASIAALEKKQPNSPLPWNYRAAAYIGKNDLAKARSSLVQALKIDPAFFPAAANLAQLDLKEGRPLDARKRFEDILKIDRNHLQAMLAMADLSLRDKNEKAYVEWLERAAKAHPKAVEPRIALARHLLARGEKNKALAIARDTVAADPDSPAALTLLGNIQLASDDASAAVTTFTALTKKTPQSPAALERLALAQLANQQFNEARASLQRALQLAPGHQPSQAALINLELSAKNPDAALRLAKQMQAQHPGSSLGFEREGDIQLEMTRLQPAIAAYRQALAKGAASTVLIKLHGAYLRAGDMKAADDLLTTWLKDNPDHHAVRAYAANHYLLTGRNKQAIAHYQVQESQTPDNVLVLNNLASLYQREKDKRALATAERALKLAPSNPAVQDTLAWILLEQGQAKRGLELLRQALAGAPGHATIRYHYAVALARTGDKSGARKELERLLATTPDFPEASEARTLLKSL